MRFSVSITKSLKQLSFAPEVARESRALFVAQTLAFQLTLDLGKSSDENVGALEKQVNDIVNEVNEFYPLDVKLVKAAFARLVHARLALIAGAGDTALLKYALASDAVRDAFGQEKQQLIESMITHPEFGHVLELTRMYAEFGTQSTAA